MSDSLTLHIFDAIARDQRVLRATEEEVEVEYVSEADSDDEDAPRNKVKATAGGGGDNRQMIINLFGSTADGRAVRVEVNGFQPFFYVRLPSCASASEEIRLKSKIEQSICAKFPTQAASMQFQLVQKKVLYGYTGDRTFPFVKIQVPSLGAFYNVRKFVMDGKGSSVKLPFGLKLYECNIDPMLRFFHIRNIQPCGWIRLDSVDLDEEDPLLLKARVDWNEVHPVVGPTVSAPFHHAFWDVECYSHDGEFPVAQQGYRRVAKQLWAQASSADEIPQLLRDAFAGTGTVQIPPLRRPAFAPKPREIATVTEKPQIKVQFTELWNGRDSLNAKDREERMGELTTLLDRMFGTMAPLAGDPIIQIGTVSWRTGDAVGKKHIFVLGGCDEIPDVTVHSCTTEKELLLKWFMWVVEQNFDVFVGYNIFGFDERYVWERLVELGVEQEECVQAMCRTFDEGGSMDLKEKFLSSSALGDNTLYMWSTTGRLRIDLMGHIKRKSQMPSYKLDSVAAAFLSGKLSAIVPLDSEGRWLLKTKQKGDARVGRYVQVLDELGEDLTEKMQIVEISADGLIVESEEELGAIAGSAARWAVVKDDVPPKEIFRLHRGSNKDRARVAAYCVQDCDLTLELYRKLEVFNEAMSMANVCSVPVSYIFTRGQGIKIESLIFKDCMVANQLIEMLPQSLHYGSGGGEQEDSYEGAIVLDPEPGFYTEAPVGVCDFASLYPSTIISENISHDMLVWAKDYDNEGKLIKVSHGSVEAELLAPPGTNFTDIEFDIWRPDPKDTRKHPTKIKVGIRLCRYAQPAGNVKGSLPTIVGKLLAARKAKRNEMAKTEDPFKKALLDAEQNAYKVTANSLYGQLGSGTFKIRLQHLAASVTAYGRKQILFAKDAIEEFYGPEAKDPRCSAKIVYGDTDSLFVCFNPVDEKGNKLNGREAIVKTIELTEEAGKFITGALKAPHDFEYDKVFYPFIIFSKKRYVGNKYEDNPDEFKETSMGIVLKRRDNAPLLKMCYGSAIDRLLNHRDIPGAITCVKEYVQQLVEGKMKLSQLTITKSLRAEYKYSTPAHKMLAERMTARDPGNAPASGDRIGYVYIRPATGQVASKLQGDRIEVPQYIQEKGLQIDAEYYIEHQLMNPLSQLFALMLEHIPGYEAPRTWAEDPDKQIAQREILAGNLLFKDGLAACRKAATRAFFGMMGVSSSNAASTSSSSMPHAKVVRVSSAVKPANIMAKQTTLQNYFRESSIIEDARLVREMRAVKTARKRASNVAGEE
jgi:DNA polymerase elongation subunit (family B)